jgi:lysophospholipase L1-like esterase
MPSLRDFFRPKSEHLFTPLPAPLHRLTLGVAGLAALTALAGRVLPPAAADIPQARSPAAIQDRYADRLPRLPDTGELAVYGGRPGEPTVDCAALARGRVMVALVFGQSNASNTADPGYDSSQPVYAFADGVCRKAHDALPGATGTKGSSWPRLGDKLVAGGFYDAVIFANIARGGSSVLHWGPGGSLNPVLLETLDTLAASGLAPTHVLFHQGEADCALGVAPDDYAALLGAVIDQLRARLHQASDILVARASLHLDPVCGDQANPSCYKTCPALTKAQTALADPDRRILSGPDTDRLLPWTDRNDGYHFTARAADRFADAWMPLLAHGDTTGRVLQ